MAHNKNPGVGGAGAEGNECGNTYSLPLIAINAQAGFVDAALAYASCGVPVFPCVPRGKEPVTPRGFYDATVNRKTIRHYWRISDRNIGIPTGKVSGVWVLDIDRKHADGEASLRALEAQYDPLPATPGVITGNGRHLWFKYTGPIQSAAGRIAPGIDQRADGGYVVAPPSIHESGRVYGWSAGGSGELAIAPDWLLALAHKKPERISDRALAAVRRPTGRASGAYGQAALEGEFAVLTGTEPGGRNYALNRAAFRLFQLVASGKLDGREVSDRLIAACHRNGLVKDDGLSSVIATIRSGSRAGLQHPRYPRDRGAA